MSAPVFDDSDLPKKGSRGSGSETAWSVEVRNTYLEPCEFGGQIFDDRWRKLRFDRATVGVPAGPEYHHNSRALGLLGYAAAQALRWWFLAELDARNQAGSLCFETRLLKHHVQYTYSDETIQRTAYVGGEDRSSILPDWGRAHARQENHPTPDVAEAAKQDEQK